MVADVSAVASALDRYFRAQDVRGDSWQVVFSGGYGSDAWRSVLEPAYLQSWNGLMVHGTTPISQVVTCVFPSASIIDALEPGTLLFTEHPIDLVKDIFAVIDLEHLWTLRRKHAGLYQVHAALDQHPQVSPSGLLAQALRLTDVEEYFPVAEGIPGGALVIGRTLSTVAEVVFDLGLALGAEVPVRLHSQWRSLAGRVAIAAGGGAQPEMLSASLERGCQTYITGNALSVCPLPDVRAEIDAFTALARREQVSVIDGTHYGTEKLSQLAMLRWFGNLGLPARFAPGVPEVRALPA